MSLGTYVLDGHKPVSCKGIAWAGDLGRSVAQTEREGVRVSTVFLALDHQYGDGPPLLFETMVLGGEHNEECRRYATWEEAEAGHKEVCLEVFGG